MAEWQWKRWDVVQRVMAPTLPQGNGILPTSWPT
jgi:hypothetical protein